MGHNTKKIKLAIVENNFAIGGSQKLALDQLRTLDKERFDICLITLMQPNRADFYPLLSNDVPLIKINFSSYWDIRSWVTVYRALKTFDPDLVKSALFMSNMVVRVLKPFFRYKVITAEHNTNDGKKMIHRLINKFLNHLSYTTIVDSQMVAEHLSTSEGINRNRYTVVHNGVDIELVKKSIETLLLQRNSLRLTHGVLPSEKIFLTIGRLVRQKNHLRLIDAFELLRRRHNNCKLFIVGDGSLRGDLENRIKELQLGECVYLISATSDIHKFYIMADFTVLSSDHEGFCIAAMEGLAFGAPLVSTRVAGVSEYLEDGRNGFFADKTPEDMADKMDRVLNLNDSELTLFKEAARQTAEAYSLSKYGETIHKLFEEAVMSR